MKLRVIVNPRAGSGAAAKRIPEIISTLVRHDLAPDIRRTERPGHATELLRRAREDGIDCVAVVGGDGTLNEVCQGYLDEAGTPVPGPDLGLIPGGTGSDFRKTFDIGTNTAQALDRLLRSAGRPVDLGLLRLTATDGSPVHRAFINVTSFGLGGLTDRLVNESPKWWGGKAAFLVGAARALVVYGNQPVRVLVDGQTWFEGPVLNVAIANGRYFGGGMHVAPSADPADGAFDVVALGDLTRIQAAGIAQKIYSGKHIGCPRVFATRGCVVAAQPLRNAAEVLVDMDGETPGRIPLEARLVPGAITLRA